MRASSSHPGRGTVTLPPEFKQAAADAWLTGVQVGVLQDRTGKLMVRVTSSTSFEVYLVKPEKPPQKAPAETIAESI